MPKLLEKPSERLVVADNRGRIVLGAEASAKAFSVRVSDGDYILTPVKMVPEREMWLWTDNESRSSFERGIADAKAGRVTEMDFTQYLTAEDLEELEDQDKG